MELPELDRLALTRSQDTKRLARGLALVDGFGFFILAAHSPAQASAAFTYLRQEMESLRKTPVGLHVIEAYSEGETTDTPVAFQTLTARVLEPLLQPAQAVPPETLTVIDASPATATDRETWRILFQRANEIRNTLAAKVNGPLLLALPVGWEGDFALAAPDFWSVRCDVIPLPQLCPISDIPRFLPLEKVAGAQTILDKRKEETLLSKINDLSARAQINSQDYNTIEALCILTYRLATYYDQTGNLDKALVLYHDIERYTNTTRSEQIKTHQAIFNKKQADIYQVAGDNEKSHTHYKKCIGILTKQKNQTLSPQNTIILAEAHGKMAEIFQDRLDNIAAKKQYKKCLDITNSIIHDNFNPSDIETLPASLIRYSERLIAKMRLTEAASIFFIANKIMTKATQPSTIHQKRNTYIVISQQSFFSKLMNLTELTRAGYAISLRAAQELSKTYNHPPLLIADIASILHQTALFEIDSKRLDHALEYLKESVNISQSLTSYYSTHPAWEQREIECRNLIKHLESQPSPNPAATPR